MSNKPISFKSVISILPEQLAVGTYNGTVSLIIEHKEMFTLQPDRAMVIPLTPQEARDIAALLLKKAQLIENTPKDIQDQ